MNKIYRIQFIISVSTDNRIQVVSLHSNGKFKVYTPIQYHSRKRLEHLMGVYDTSYKIFNNSIEVTIYSYL